MAAPAKMSTPGALHPDSAKCHVKCQQDPVQHLRLILVPTCYSNSVRSEVFIRFKHGSRRTGAEKELVALFSYNFPKLESITFPTQCAAPNHPLPHSVLKHFSTEKRNTHPQKPKLLAPDTAYRKYPNYAYIRICILI